ncbi:MAG: hypothetical protein KIG35_07635, partial [Prevotellamassilia sp.]|nr:hypothetical protein [Prevotellamassilia sp.]
TCSLILLSCVGKEHPLMKPSNLSSHRERNSRAFEGLVAVSHGLRRLSSQRIGVFCLFLPIFPQIITTFAPFFEEDIISQKEQTNTFHSI